MTTSSRPLPSNSAPWALVALAVVSIVGGNLIGALGLFGPSTGEISDSNFPIPIVPAGWAFSIWSFIYPALLALAIAQATRWGEVRAGIVRTRLPLTVNLVFNLAWLITFAQEWFVVNNLILIGQLASGLWIYRALGRERDSGAWLERFIRIGVSVYAGWLTVATVVGTAATLHAVGWSGFGLGATTWTALLLVVATAIGLSVRTGQRDPAYGVVFVWAFVAIALNDDSALPVDIVAFTGAALFAASLAAGPAWTARRTATG